MPQQKRYGSDAEKQAAYRERQRLEPRVAAEAEQLKAAFAAGLAGEEAPYEDPRSSYERDLCLAWSKGVWQRQANAEERRRRRKLAEFEAEQKREVPEQSPEARAARAAAYEQRQ